MSRSMGGEALAVVPHPEAKEAEQADPPPPPRRAPRLLVGLSILALLAALGAWWLGHGLESTDNAQLEGHIVNVAARVPGQVLRVLVRDNQAVQAGDVLVELDPAELQAKLELARADVAAANAALSAARVQLELARANGEAGLRQARGGLTQAASSLASNHSALEQVRAEIQGALSRYRLAKRELERARSLAARQMVPEVELEGKQLAHDQAWTQLELARAKLRATKAGIRGAAGGIELARGRLVAAKAAPQQVESARAAVEAAEARLEQAEAAMRLATLQVGYTTVRATMAGVVSRRSVEPGQLVGPDRTLMALVSTRDVWVVANFKEDQLGDMRPGQRAEVRIDALGGRPLPARVDSLAAATGAKFSLLPPDNASGNFIKVVQRVPVLIRFAGDPGVALRPGLSAEVTVWTE